MHRWRVGDVDIVRIEDIDLALPSPVRLPSWCVPAFAPSPDEFRIAFSALVVRDGDTVVVADPWLVNDNPRTEPDADARIDGLLARLGDAGVAVDDVDVVVNSHYDGIGWNTRPKAGGWALTFPGARYLYPADEVADIERGNMPGAEPFSELARLTDIERVDGVRRLTTAVTVEPAPGHNAGHIALRIESGGELALYLGHLVLHPRQIVDPGEDPDEPQTEIAASSRRRYLDELAERDGLLLTTLIGGPGGGRVRRDGDGFRLEVT